VQAGSSRGLAFDFDRLRSGPFEGPATVIPPALPEDTYFLFINMTDTTKTNLIREKCIAANPEIVELKFG
jgi:hypothetical protein